MTVSLLTAANSTASLTGVGKALATGDTLDILAGGFAATLDPLGSGVVISGRVSTTTYVTNNGDILGNTSGIVVGSAVGQTLDLIVGATGTISATQYGVRLSTSGAPSRLTMTNSGTIEVTDSLAGGTGQAISVVNGDLFLTNTGLIGGAMRTFQVSETGTFTTGAIDNSGRINGSVFLSGATASSVTVDNSGTIDGDVTLSAHGSVVILNHGFINGGISATSLAGGVSVHLDGGTVNRDVSLSLKGFSVVKLHDATIMGNFTETGDFAIQFGSFNGAQIDGNFTLGNFGYTTNISGMTVGGNVQIGNGADTLTFHRGIVDGDFTSGAGNDVLDLVGGQVHGRIDAGAGDDSVQTGATDDKVADGLGDDNYDLGAGNDRLLISGSGAADGSDVTDGGAGIDTLDLSAVFDNYTAATGSLFVSLEEGQLRGAATNSTNLFGIDVVLNFENVIGGVWHDTIVGSADANRLLGGGGNDSLTGNGGDDILRGGLGDDRLTGGTGRDILTGGDGADVFIFSSIGESGPARAARDIITDFAEGTDRISVAAIDAVASLAGKQAFTFIGSANAGGEGTLRTVIENGNTLVLGNVDGTATAEFSILLHGIHVLTAADFIFA